MVSKIWGSCRGQGSFADREGGRQNAVITCFYFLLFLAYFVVLYSQCLAIFWVQEMKGLKEPRFDFLYKIYPKKRDMANRNLISNQELKTSSWRPGPSLFLWKSLCMVLGREEYKCSSPSSSMVFHSLYCHPAVIWHLQQYPRPCKLLHTQYSWRRWDFVRSSGLPKTGETRWQDGNKNKYRGKQV